MATLTERLLDEGLRKGIRSMQVLHRHPRLHE